LGDRQRVSTTEFKKVVAYFQPILPFDREERASKNQKQNTVTFQRGAEASSSTKRNKWAGPVYAGFELELAGAQR
jgi:hypothetical protein